VKTESQKHSVRRVIWIAPVAFGFAALAFYWFADAAVASWIHAHSAASLKRAADWISWAGDWPAHVILGLAGMSIGYLIRRKDWQRIFLAMLIACALAGIAARVIKVATGRARPSVKSEAVWGGPKLSAKYNSFPSGHTASSTAFFVALFAARRKIGAPLLIVPIVIAAARIISGAHYLSDVTFAAGLGILCAELSCNALGCQRRDTS
jgi:membrane-associated phospholipid phosphatase